MTNSDVARTVGERFEGVPVTLQQAERLADDARLSASERREIARQLDGYREKLTAIQQAHYDETGATLSERRREMNDHTDSLNGWIDSLSRDLDRGVV